MKCLNSSKLAVVLGSATLALTLMSGCSTFSGAESNHNLNKLKYGMSEDQVLNVLGTPDSVVRQTQTQDRWVYEFRRQDKAGHNLFVEFNNDALVKSGELNGRELAAEEPNQTSGVCTKHVHHEMVQDSLCIK